MSTTSNYTANRQSLPLFTASIQSLIHLDRDSDEPLYQQISREVREAIASGELAEGTRLPTERALARELGVNRTTVMNAYNQLASEGLIEGHVGRGTIVKRSRSYINDRDAESCEQESPSWLLGLAAGEEIALGADARVLSELTAINGHEEVISFASGTPSPDMLPGEPIRAIVDKALVGDEQNALGYCPVEGLQSLRRGIAVRMRQRNVIVDPQNILILSGSTQGIGLIARFLLNPGDEVVVETPTYLGAVQVFRALGARVIGLPIDRDGMRVDLLEAILARKTPRFIYTQPTFQNPTGAVMSVERRRRLLALARRYQIPIVEDDPYGELYFGDKAPLPLKALDTSDHVLYLSTFSKSLAPGLRVAWLAAPEQMIERLSLHKQIFDLNTNAIGQWVASEVIRCGMLDEHLLRMRHQYKYKRDIMLHTIHTYWPQEIRVNTPGGGFHLWCRLPATLGGRALLREAAQQHVAFVAGEPFHVDGGGRHAIRLSFSSSPTRNIETGIQRIGTVMHTMLARRAQHEERDTAPAERLPVM